MPPLLGFPIDGRVHIVDTATGRAVQAVQPERDVRLVVVGGRLLRIEARAQDGTCYYTVIGRDPSSGQEVWRYAGVNLRTADGAGCVQREDPQGARNVVVGVAPDSREAVIDAYDRAVALGRGDRREAARRRRPVRPCPRRRQEVGHRPGAIR